MDGGFGSGEWQKMKVKKWIGVVVRKVVCICGFGAWGRKI